MADESQSPGFISGLINSLGKDKNSIPQSWLDAIQAGITKNLPKQLDALINNSFAVSNQLSLQSAVLRNLDKSLGPALEKTLLETFKKYDKEYLGKDDSASSKLEDKKYKEREKVTEKKHKELLTAIEKNVTAQGAGPSTKDGAQEAANVLADIPVQPVSVVSIEPLALSALQKVFSSAIGDLAGAKEAPAAAGVGGDSKLGFLGTGLSGIANALKKLGTKEALLGTATLIGLGAALFVSAKGFQEFAEVNWIGMGKGFVALLGLVVITKLLASSSAQMLLGAATLVVLGLAVIAAGKGFQMFGELDWSAIGKGFTALLGLGVVAVAFGAFIGVIVPGAIAIGLLGLALIPFAYALGKTAEALQVFTAVEWESIGKAAVALIALGAVGSILGVLSPLLLLASIALIPFSLAIYTLSLGLESLSKINLEDIQNGMVALKEVVKAVLDIGVFASAKLLIIGPALVIGSLGLIAFATAMNAISEVNYDNVQEGATAINAFVISLGPLGILAPGLALIGIALMPFSLGLWAVGKAINSLAEVDFSAVNDGVVALFKFIAIISPLGVLAPLLALVGIALLPFSLGLYTMGKAISSFISNDWDGVDEALVVLLKFGAVGAVLGIVSPLLVAASVGIIAFSVALLPFAGALALIESPLKSFVDQLDRLSSISATDILALSGSIVALGIAIAGFGAGAAAAGIGNFVGGLFSSLSGQKSPIDQLIAIGQQADNIGKVSSSIGALKASLANFGDIEGNFDPLKDFAKTINDISLVKLLAFTAALSLSAPTTALSSTTPSTEIMGPASAAGNIPPSIQTENGPALPVSIISTQAVAVQSKKMVNDVFTNPQTIAEAPGTQTESVDKIVQKLEELIKNLSTLTSMGSNTSALTNQSSSSIINTTNNSKANTSGDGSSRDNPYIERNKYRRDMLYTRGLL
jgi:hypothetical protein